MNVRMGPLQSAGSGAHAALLEHHSSICFEIAQREEAHFKVFSWQEDRGSALEEEIGKAYREFVPTPEDYQLREKAIGTFRKFVENELPGAEVIPFGSFVMELTLPSGDVDLSVEAPITKPYDKITKSDRVKVLTRLTKALRQAQKQGYVRGVAPVMRATVPVLRFVDVHSRLEMDVSISNRDGVFKSRFLRLVVNIDPRYRILAYLVKKWARHMEINDAKTGSLNTLSLYLLVAFHLQTVSPPVLPPFIDIMGEAALSGSVPELSALEACNARVQAHQNFGRRNTESVAKLLTTFFHRLLLVEGMWDEGLCASTLLGRWIHKEWKQSDAIIKVEDFADVTVNTARAVRPGEKKRIYDCIRQAARTLQNARPPVASALLFGPPSRRQGHPGAPAQQGILPHQQQPQPAQQNPPPMHPFPAPVLSSPQQNNQAATAVPVRQSVPQDIMQMPGHGNVMGHQLPMPSFPTNILGHTPGAILRPPMHFPLEPSPSHANFPPNLPPYQQQQQPQHHHPLSPLVHHSHPLTQVPLQRPRPYQPPGVLLVPTSVAQSPSPPLVPHMSKASHFHTHSQSAKAAPQAPPELQLDPRPLPGLPNNGLLAQPATLDKGMLQDGAFVRLRSVPHMSKRGPSRNPN